MLVYRYNEITKEFVGSEEALINPLETELSGKDVYLLPANCTYTPPLEEKDGCVIVWEDSKWIYKEIITVSEIEKELTPEQLKWQRILELKHYLSSTDWYAIRFADTGEPIPDDIKQQRKDARDEISRLRESISD